MIENKIDFNFDTFKESLISLLTSSIRTSQVEELIELAKKATSTIDLLLEDNKRLKNRINDLENLVEKKNNFIWNLQYDFNLAGNALSKIDDAYRIRYYESSELCRKESATK